MVMRDINFAVCLSVRLFGRITSETDERIWLKICTGTGGVCPGHCITHFSSHCSESQGSRQGSRKCTMGTYCVSLALTNLL